MLWKYEYEMWNYTTKTIWRRVCDDDFIDPSLV